MRIVDGAQVASLLDYRSLIDALRDAFRSDVTMPMRHHHSVDVPGAPEATLLLMPAWRAGEHLGVKIVTVFPGNAAAGKPAVAASYILYDARDGRQLALIDGAVLTARRTAAASVLAAIYLARGESERLLVVGTGTIAGSLARAYPTAFAKLKEIAVWGRNAENARALAERLRAEGLPASPAPDLEAAARTADIITCATLAREPLIHGAWLKTGQHLDLVGGFTPEMREADDAAIAKARVVVDTDGALTEAGDIVRPLKRGVIMREAIVDLAMLARGEAKARSSADELTLFKSVGAALEDLAAATLVYRRLSK